MQIPLAYILDLVVLGTTITPLEWVGSLVIFFVNIGIALLRLFEVIQ